MSEDSTEPKSNNPLFSQGTLIDQFNWVCAWLEKHKLFTTLDALIEEGASLGSLENLPEQPPDADSETRLRTNAGSGSYATAELKTISGMHKSNVLSIRFCDVDEPLCVSSSVDKTVKLFNSETGDVLHTASHWIGPQVSLDPHPHHPLRFLCGGMDHSHSIVEFKLDDQCKYTSTLLHNFKHHKKHVVRAKWSPTGKHFATASYDGSCALYGEEEDGSWKLLKEFAFGKAVETVLFNKDGTQLIIAVREDNYLHYINTETLQEHFVNMNATGDDHVSFTALDMSLSPDGKFVLVSTDRNRLIMFATGTPFQARNFYGVPNDQWSTPRTAWNLTQSFIYSTTDEKSIYVCDVATTKRVHALEGHTGVVRDVHRHPRKELLATCSYDKTVKLWQ